MDDCDDEEHCSIPVMVDRRVVGYLPAFVAPYGSGCARYRMRHRGKLILTVELEIGDQCPCGVPGDLHAKDFVGLLAIPDFTPEDWFLNDLIAGDLRR